MYVCMTPAPAAQCWREKLLLALMPLASAAVRSHSELRSFWPSTLVGPPLRAVLVLQARGWG